MKLPKSKGMVIDGVAASQCIDSSGEVIDVAGVDCARFEEAGGILLNWEHEPGETGAHTIVGRLIYLKKIYKESDCENDRQRMFWNKCKQTPYIYVIARLFDGSGHKNAREIAAIIRDNKKHGEPLACRFSIEGTTAEREGNKLKSSVFRRLAVTLSPCNKTANTDLLEDNDPEWGDVKKYENSNPLLKKIGGAVRIEYDPVFEDLEIDDAPDQGMLKIQIAAKMFQNMTKALSAGMGDAAPSTLTNGSALQKEDEDLARKAVDLLKTFDQPFTREAFAAFTKAQLPEVSDAFVEHFTDIAENMHLKKGSLTYRPLGPSLRKYTNVMESNIIQLRKSVREAMAGSGFQTPEFRALKLRIGGQEHPAGMFMIHQGNVSHISDYHGILESMLPEGPISVKALTALHGLQYNPDLAVRPVDPQMPVQPMAPTAPAEVVVQPQAQPQPPAVFDYHRPGMYRPHVVEFGANGASIDGSKLTDSELELIMDNVARGVGTLRYKTPPQNLSKAEPLQAPQDLEDALQHIRLGVAQGILHPDVERMVTKAAMEDSMVDGVGSKYAWKKFHAKQKPGVYLSMDGNDFKSVNDTHGHQAGDDAITAMGGALRAAADKTGMGKLFRTGGDEFAAHFPTHQDATTFIRHAREHLDQLAPVKGTHKLTLSFGIGNDYHTADKVALQKAKESKTDPISGGRAFPPGQAPHFAYSAVPGSEGHVNLHHEVAPAGTIPAPKPVTPTEPAKTV